MYKVMEIRYYHIKPMNRIGRFVFADESYWEDGVMRYSVYQLWNGTDWVDDTEHQIQDRLVGFDPSEPPGSPYRIGCLSIMDEISEITKEEAEEIAGCSLPE